VTDAARWRAVLDKDRRLDGAFVFAVRSTGVYCRPSCPSRRPRRENVAFFQAPDEAESAGFRSCRRCRPKEAAGAPGTALAKRVCRLIEERIDEPVRLTELAASVGLSPRHLLRVFKGTVGITPRQYADARRVGALKSRLKEGWPVTHAIYEAGYGSSSRLYESSDARLGMTPATYRRGGRGMRIGYSVVDCALGRMLVASTDRGVSAVYFGDTDSGLAKDLHAEYPEADIRPAEKAHADWVRALAKRVTGGEAPDVPLDIRVTAFQWRVFEALREIPAGETRTYGDIARGLGEPKAARAVGRACATNPVAVAIPCHRAVGASGTMTGYRWGIARKRALLEAEATGDARPSVARGR
jgi:AraC family transcriptional regulator of adaptative response/methylated-DNA-[protein]-cysteine methyltransferase